MFSFKNGIFSISRSLEDLSKFIFEICFVVNVLSIFLFDSIGMVAPLVTLVMFSSSVFLLFVKHEKHIIIPVSAIWFAMFILYAAISTLWARYTSNDTIEYLIKMAIMLLATMSISFYVSTVADLEKIMVLFTLCVTTIVLMELISVPYSEWFVSDMGSHISGANKNIVGFWAACAEYMAFYRGYMKGKKWQYLIVVLMVFFIILTASRKAIIMSVIGPSIMIILSTEKKHYFLRIISMVLIVVGLFAFIMTNESTYASMGRRIESMFDFFSTDMDRSEDNSLYLRFYYIEVAKQIFEQHPVFGSGFRTFNLILHDDFAGLNTYSHNNYWQILSEFGIVGLIMYYWFYIYCMVKLVKRFLKKKDKIAIVFLAFFVTLLVLEYGLVTIYSKYCQIVIAIAFTATYVVPESNQKYRYLSNYAEHVKTMEE